MALSARNQLQGKIDRIKMGDIMAHVTVKVGKNLIESVITRNSAAAVVGTLMFSLLIQLIGILPGLTGLQPYLLSTQFNAWQGLLRTPIDWAPIVRAAWVCALYGVPALIAACLVFLRRDVAGG